MDVSPARRNAIYQAVDAANVSIVCLQETKMEVISNDIVRHYLGNKFEGFFYVPGVVLEVESSLRGIFWWCHSQIPTRWTTRLQHL